MQTQHELVACARCTFEGPMAGVYLGKSYLLACCNVTGGDHLQGAFSGTVVQTHIGSASNVIESIPHGDHCLEPATVTNHSGQADLGERYIMPVSCLSIIRLIYLLMSLYI